MSFGKHDFLPAAVRPACCMADLLLDLVLPGTERCLPVHTRVRLHGDVTKSVSPTIHLTASTKIKTLTHLGPLDRIGLDPFLFGTASPPTIFPYKGAETFDIYIVYYLYKCIGWYKNGTETQVRFHAKRISHT
ncbi:unnamed protein product [Ixodes persulcatus]